MFNSVKGFLKLTAFYLLTLFAMFFFSERLFISMIFIAMILCERFYRKSKSEDRDLEVSTFRRFALTGMVLAFITRLTAPSDVVTIFMGLTLNFPIIWFFASNIINISSQEFEENSKQI